MKKKNMVHELKKVILIVEDYDYIRSLVGKLFQQDGYDVISAGNMHEAMTLAGIEQPKMVIVDFDMQSNDPCLIVSILHNILPLSHILMIDGRSRHCNRDEAMTAGVNKILDRGFDPMLLEEIIHQPAMQSVCC